MVDYFLVHLQEKMEQVKDDSMLSCSPFPLRIFKKNPSSNANLLLQGFGELITRSVLNQAEELLRVKSMQTMSEPTKEVLKPIRYLTI